MQLPAWLPFPPMPLIRHFLSLVVCLALLCAAISARGADDASALVKTYCSRCHSPEKHQADVDLTAIGERPTSLAGRKIWQKVLEQLKTEEMPPEAPLPTGDERRVLIAWAEAALKIDWTKIRNPGRVTIPRLTREEYRHTLRDLLGIDLNPAAEFSADGAGASGFNTDRDALFLTPALLEKYLAAADAALEACVALEHEPTTQHFESEAMLMTETREQPRDFGDGFNGYVLNRGQMTLYNSVRLPFDGFYRFTARVRSARNVAGARMRIDGETAGDVVARGTEPQNASIVCFVKAGSHQMTWNIQGPGVDAPQAQPMARQQQAQQKAKAKAKGKAAPQPMGSFKPLPANADVIVTQEAEKHSPRYPETGNETQEARQLIRRVNAGALAVQRPHEWLRLLGTEGDPREIARFKGYILQRSKAWDEAKNGLAEALGQSREEFDRRYQEHNRERLADNKRLVNAVAHIPAQASPMQQQQQPPANQPSPIAIDWIEIRGPIHPEGEGQRSRVFTARPSENRSARQAAETIIADFLPRAFRRPVDGGEIDHYLQLYDRSANRGESFEQSVKLSLLAVLVSPKFLYRNEFGPTDGEYRLDDYQLASRLSYFLWQSMPDDELLSLAAKKQLREPSVLKAQVGRMLADRKSRAFIAAFVGQWLGTDALGISLQPDAAKFPQFTPQLGEAMKEEPVLMFQSLLKDNGSLLSLLDARKTWLNEPLAKHYGINDVRGEQMRAVKLEDTNRGGLLGMAGVLTITSSASRTSPVVRGKWVLETLLGEKTPEPPPDAGALEPEAGETRNKTLREELLNHRRNASCAVCHNKIDPIGFGLEGFDAIGAFRREEAGRPVDNSGELPGGSTFRGAAELKQLLVRERKAEFLRNVVERLLSFALGRKLELYDEPTIAAISEAVAADNYQACTLVEQIVLSYPFQNQSNKDTVE
jgi:uncharacterized protein DUF1592/uncharacterized protein DUF1588/uncharacterized protein DUF1585/uncharacterized protein DUF1595/uncharacterized protein DUF1587/cytochrome c